MTEENIFDAAMEEGNARTVGSMQESIMLAIQTSMFLTTPDGPYTHDHYDIAMADLQKLVRLANKAVPEHRKMKGRRS